MIAVWILCGCGLALAVFFTAMAFVEYRKCVREINRAKSALLENQRSLGLQVFRSGLGYVPSDGRLR